MNFNILPIHIGLSIDDFLLSYHVSSKVIYKIKQLNAVSVNNKLVNEQYILKVGDVIFFDLSLIEKNETIPYKKSIAILYEDEDIIIINKENSCLVHSDGQSIDTVANHLSYYYVKSCQNLTVRPVHRLDYETSGMVIFAKNFLSHAYLSYLLENRKIIKVYECLCENSFKEKVGIINANIGKNRHEDKQIITKKGQSALTKYKVMSNKETLSMLEVTIKTGRKHQIRVHLSSIKHPIVGDVMYGARPSDRLYLHFSYIKFVHPRTMKTFEYQCKSNFGEK